MAEIPHRFWIGKDEHGGIPVPVKRPDAPPAKHWRLADIAATERPRHPRLSPDGSTILFTLDRDGGSDVWTMPVAGGQPTRITTIRDPAPSWEDDLPAWSTDGTTIVFNHRGTLQAIAATGGGPSPLIEASSPAFVAHGRVAAVVERDERSVLVTFAAGDRWPAVLYTGEGDVVGPEPSPDGERLAFAFHPFDDLNCSEIIVVDVVDGATTTAASFDSMHARGPAWSPDGARLAFSCEAPGWYEIFEVEVAGGEPRQVTTDGADFSDLIWHPDGATITAIRTRHGVSDLVRVDVATGEITLLAEGGTWSSPCLLLDGAVVAAHESHAIAPRLVSIGASGEQTVLFAPTPAAIAAAPHRAPEHVWFPSFDGRMIPAFLFRPEGDGPFPAVVYPHGGPTSLYGDEWDGPAQRFLDKGYAWLAINFRGSTSYGRDHERADHGVWGVDDTKDCLAAHDFLATLGWVDASRVAIFGSSYGSYMALCSVVDDPQHRYRAAVAKYGDCDLVTSWAQGDRGGRLDLERMMRRPQDDRVAYRNGSPIHRIEQVQVPILVAHGEQDDRVNPAQSEELVEALRRLGKTFQYVTYPTEAHGLLRASPMIDFYERLERFLDWYLM